MVTNFRWSKLAQVLAYDILECFPMTETVITQTNQQIEA